MYFLFRNKRIKKKLFFVDIRNIKFLLLSYKIDIFCVIKIEFVLYIYIKCFFFE